MAATDAPSPDRAETIRLIRDSAAAVAPRGGDLRRIRALRFTEPGFDRDTWREIGALGWIGLRVPEAQGGAGLGMAEFCALAEELGRGLVPEPLVAGALAARLHPAPDLLDGSRVILPAWQERANTLDGGGNTRLAGGKLTGRKLFIPMAAGADAFLVATREGLALVARGEAGVSLELDRTQDGGHVGTLHLDGAPAEPVPAAAPLEEALDEAALATAAYLLGVMERVFAMTVDYMKTRRQFGRPIGSFQALRHRAADLAVQISLTRASVESTAALLDAGAAGAPRRAAVSRAKARASDAALLVTRQAIQLHGGIAYTDEYDAGLFLRKAMVLANAYGSAALHRARFAADAPEGDED